MKKSILFICLSALLLPAVLMATDGPPPFHKGPNEAVKKYIKERIMPALLQKREQFDRELTEDEKSEISACLTALKQLRSQHHDWKAGSKGDNLPSPDNNQVAPKEAQHPDFEQRKAIIARLQAIADKHSNSLHDIKTQLEPARKQWLADMKKLQPVEENSKNDNQLKDDKPYGGRPMGHGHDGFGFAHHMEAVHFLLLSANPDDQPIEELKADFDEPAGIPAISASKLTSFTVMPNPATNDMQLGTDILPANNQLKIVDVQGKEVLTLENVQASQHLNVSQLANGTYLVQIKSGDQVMSKKLVINR